MKIATVAVYVENQRDALRFEMSARGVPFQQPPQDMPWGPFAIFVDSEGNWFGIREGAPTRA